MKKILIYILLGFSLLSTGIMVSPIQQTYATDTIQVTVTEKVPGAGCQKQDDGDLYECNLATGFGAIMQIIGNMIKYATFIASLAGVLFIVINGILYSMSGMDAGMKDEAKKRIVKTLLGLIVLLLSGVILNAIAPWVYVV